jgi:insertion element IS1 protein InsB
MSCGALSGAKPTSSGSPLAFDPDTRQVLAFYVGDHSRRSAHQLWKRIPHAYREQATFYTDDWVAYKGVIPESRP